MIKGTRILREQNKRKVLSLIRRLGETSRKDLVNKMDVSKNTISLIVDEFIQQNVLIEVGVQEIGKKGRPKIIIKINEDYLKAVGISVSKNSIDYTVTNYYGSVIERKSVSFDCSNAEATKKEIMRIIRTLMESYNHVIGIGIGFPAIVDINKKYLHTSTHLGWSDVSLKELSHSSIPITVQNSVNMGAMEAVDKERIREDDSSFYLRVSEGVGGAYIIKNNLVDGGSWTAGEIGHISIITNGERCVCGQKGCLEQLINYNALMEDLKSIGFQFPTLINNDLSFDNEYLESTKVKELMSKYGRYFGKALIYVIHLMNPKKLIIDTPYNVFDEFQEACLIYLSENALHIPFDYLDITFGKDRYNLSRGAALSTIISYELMQ